MGEPLPVPDESYPVRACRRERGHYRHRQALLLRTRYGKGGKIEYSDHYHFLDDERVYLTKLYGDGKPLDSTSFIVLDITNLAPTPKKVLVVRNEYDVNATIIGQPISVDHSDARLASLKIGNKALTPPFNKSVFVYTCATTDGNNAITAVAMDGEAEITIKNSETEVANGASATGQLAITPSPSKLKSAERPRPTPSP